MYIEQLTNAEIETIFKMIISTVDNEQEVAFRTERMKIERWDNCIRCIFPTAYETHICVLEDFETYLSYGAYDTPEKIRKLYRRYMYNKFGENYLVRLEKHCREPIKERYNKEMSEIDNQIAEITEI